MSNTITIDNVPEGFELTGECEAYPLVRTNTLEPYAMSACIHLRKLEPPTPPAGFEHIKEGGERRTPRAGEYWLNKFSPDMASGPSNGSGAEMGPRWILRKVWTPPRWLVEHYKGCWLWKYEGYGLWFVTEVCPASFGYKPRGVEAAHLATLHGETFTPPTHTDCLQIS